VSSDDAVRAAGAVLWRAGADGSVEIALVHRPRYDDWSLPKGKNDPGEHAVVTAVREVLEETGHRVALGRPLGVQRYDTLDRASGQVRPKRVDYWAGRALDGEHVPGHEVDALDWLPVAAARARLSYDRDRVVLDRFCAAPVDTVPLVLLRHAEALQRASWTGDDAQRPLTVAGLAQAAGLASVLAAFGSPVPVSSPTARTVATVQPYADAVGLRVRLDARLDEPHAGSGAPADVVRELLADGGPAVVCTHRPDLPEMLAALEAVGAPSAADGAPLEPAELLVAHVRDGRVVAAERHHP
jgi:8-oxo-dGTP diphosphatase